MTNKISVMKKEEKMEGYRSFFNKKNNVESTLEMCREYCIKTQKLLNKLIENGFREDEYLIIELKKILKERRIKTIQNGKNK